MIHIQAPIANAIRRIMIAEVLPQITYRSQQWLYIKFRLYKIQVLSLMKFWLIV